MKSLQVIHGRLLGRPADDEALCIACSWLGDNVEVDVIDFLVRDAPVILWSTGQQGRSEYFLIEVWTWRRL